MRFVLVHGAWCGGWIWRDVAERLRAAGHEVWTPTLTGLGDRAHLAGCGVDLDLHVEDVVAVLELENLRDVVLLGHSYGGMVVAGVADRVPKRISQVVHLDSAAPQHGESLRDSRPEIVATMVATARAGLVPPFKPDVIGMDGAPAEVIAWAVDRMRPMPVAVLEQPLRLTGAGASLPHTYVWCTQSGYGHVAARARADGWEYRELDSPHCAMLVVPEQLTDLLLSL